MRCPKCSESTLKQRTVQNTRTVVDCCAACKGVWFDADELKAVLPAAEGDLGMPPGAKKTQMPCPKCRAPLMMFRYPHTHVEVDMCNSCKGLWLQPGEFKQIKKARENLRALEDYEQGRGRLAERALPKSSFSSNRFKEDLLAWIDEAIASLTKLD